MGDLAVREWGMGDLAAGEWGMGDLAVREWGMGDLAAGEWGMGDLAVGEWGMGDLAVGEWGMGDLAAGEWGMGDLAHVSLPRLASLVRVSRQPRASGAGTNPRPQPCLRPPTATECRILSMVLPLTPVPDPCRAGAAHADQGRDVLIHRGAGVIQRTHPPRPKELSSGEK